MYTTFRSNSQIQLHFDPKHVSTHTFSSKPIDKVKQSIFSNEKDHGHRHLGNFLQGMSSMKSGSMPK